MNTTTDRSGSGHQPPGAFTLVELLVILGMLAVGAALLTPALARTPPNSKAFQCLNNHRQLCRAWLMFADDNNGRLLDARAWVDEYGAYNLTPYLGNTQTVYKCPGDPRATAVRSVSMNCYIGKDLWDPNYIGYTTLASMNRPSPANIFVILDENANSINDGFFAVDMTGFDPYQPGLLAFVDIPAAFHNNAGSLSFADGHAEAHKWRDPRTLKAQLFISSPNNTDVAWIQEHATRKLNNPTR